MPARRLVGLGYDAVRIPDEACKMATPLSKMTLREAFEDAIAELWCHKQIAKLIEIESPSAVAVTVPAGRNHASHQ